jgi:uncharacterized protein YjeT (DUF2065 family)
VAQLWVVRPLDLSMTLRGQFKTKRQGDDMVAGTPMLEARARIIWGESSSSVRGFLTSKGIPTTEADSKIREYQHERNTEIRKIGIRSILIGLLVLFLATFALYLFAWPIDRGSIALANRGDAVVVFVGLYGVWKLGIGLVYLIYPQSVRKSVSDVGESDVFGDTFEK